jgi:hypothetical protein
MKNNILNRLLVAVVLSCKTSNLNDSKKLVIAFEAKVTAQFPVPPLYRKKR